MAHLNPEDEQVIRGISDRIKSELIKLEKLISNNSTNPGDLIGSTSHEIDIVEKLYEDYNKQIGDFYNIVSYRIDKDFKIDIEFKITCRADIPISIPIFMRDKFRYNFEVSYIKDDLDELGICDLDDLRHSNLNENERDKYLAISYGYENNFFLIMKPSSGKWK